MTPLRIAVLFGGRSGEHEVSLVSAASVMEALSPDRYHILPVGIDKAGIWRVGQHAMPWLRGEDVPCPPRAILPPEPGFGGLLVETERGWNTEPVDVVFPVLHGTFGEDGTVQGLLDLAELPYVGAGVCGSAVAMDKVIQKKVHRAAGLPVTEFLDVPSHRVREDIDTLLVECERHLGYPVFIKPPNLGSSVGISKAKDRASLKEGLELAARFDRWVLVEQAVADAREIEVAILGNEHPIASMPGEIVASNEFYDYDAKYVDGASVCTIPADLEPALRERVRTMAVRAYREVRAEGLARVDFLLCRGTGEVFINEINTMPGFTSISMYPKLFAEAGIAYSALVDRLVALAFERHRAVRALERSYSPKTAWHREGNHG